MKSKQTKLEVVDKLTLAKIVANRQCITISEATSLIDSVEDVIVTSVKNNKKVQLNDFLTFTPDVLEEKKIVSPLDKKEYIVPRKRVVKITVGKGFKKAIQEGLEKDKGKKK